MTAAMPPEVFAEREAAVPMKRAGEPAEVAGAGGIPGFDLGQLHHRHGHRGRRRPIHMTPVAVSAAAGIGTIVLNRPEQLNAVNVELAVALERALVTLARSRRSTSVLIRGANGNFCAGGDFAEVRTSARRGARSLEFICSRPSAGPATPSPRSRFPSWRLSRASPQRAVSSSCRPPTSCWSAMTRGSPTTTSGSA